MVLNPKHISQRNILMIGIWIKNHIIQLIIKKMMKYSQNINH